MESFFHGKREVEEPILGILPSLAALKPKDVWKMPAGTVFKNLTLVVAE